MSTRASCVRVGAQVIVDISDKPEILNYMGLTDDSGQPLKGIRMRGRVQAAVGTNWKVYLQATEREHFFNKEKTQFEICTRPTGKQITYHCVVDDELQEVTGLLLPDKLSVNGYHLTKAQARKELLLSRATSEGSSTVLPNHCVPPVKNPKTLHNLCAETKQPDKKTKVAKKKTQKRTSKPSDVAGRSRQPKALQFSDQESDEEEQDQDDEDPIDTPFLTACDNE